MRNFSYWVKNDNTENGVINALWVVSVCFMPETMLVAFCRVVFSSLITALVVLIVGPGGVLNIGVARSIDGASSNQGTVNNRDTLCEDFKNA